MPEMKKIMSLLLAVCLLSCSSTKQAKQETDAVMPISEWFVTSIGGEQVKSGVHPYIAFDAVNGSYWGNAACNTIRGKLEADAKRGKIKFGAPVSTRMYCPDMDVENSLVSALTEVVAYNASGDSLSLVNEDGKVIVSAVRKRPIDGRWIFEEVKGQKVGATENIPFLEIYSSEGRVHGNLGCNMYNSSIGIDCTNGTLEFGLGQMTLMACPDLELEGSINKALSEVRSFNVEGDSLHLLDGSGAEVLLMLRD